MLCMALLCLAGAKIVDDSAITIIDFFLGSLA